MTYRHLLLQACCCICARQIQEHMLKQGPKRSTCKVWLIHASARHASTWSTAAQGDVWQSYDEASAYGQCVYTHGGSRGSSLAYFMPHLSAVQLFTSTPRTDAPAGAPSYIVQTTPGKTETVWQQVLPCSCVLHLSYCYQPAECVHTNRQIVCLMSSGSRLCMCQPPGIKALCHAG